MKTRSIELARGALATLMLLALVAGVPAGLAHFVGWPLPANVPSWSTITNTLTGHDAFNTTVIVNTLAVVVWLGWAQFTYSVATEFVAATRGRVVRPRPGFALSHHLAAALISAILVLAPTGFSSGSAAARPAPASASAPLRDHPLITHVHADKTPARPLSNKQPTRPAIKGPAAQPPRTRPPAPSGATATTRPAAPPASVANPTQAVTHLVVRGDTLWGIAEHYYGDGTQCVKIFEANRGIDQPSGGRLTNISLIQPDWVLTIPAATSVPAAQPAPVAPVEAAAPVPPAVESAPTPTTTPTVTVPSTDSAPTDTATPPVSPPAPSTTVTTETPAAADGPPMPVIPTTNVAPAVEQPTVPATPAPLTPSNPPAAPTTVPVPAAAAAEPATLPSRAPVIPGIAGATVLASGLLLALRRVRRRRNVRSTSPRQRADWRSTVLEQAIIAAADVPLVRWAGQELAELAPRLDPRKVAGAPIAVELAAASGLELLWDTPNPTAPSPWEATDGGWAWRLLYDPDAPVPPAEYPCPLAGLVTVGHRDGRQLLIDLESCGSLAVTGDPHAAEAFVRAVVLELGAGDEVADAYVTTVGLDVDGVEQLGRVHSADSATAIASIASTVSSVDRALARSGAATTFAYRIGQAELSPLEVTVAVMRGEDDASADALVAAARAHRGVAAIVVGDAAGAGARLILDSEGRGRLEPLGVAFDAVGVTREVAAQVAVLLDEAPTEPDDATTRHLQEQLALIVGVSPEVATPHDNNWGQPTQPESQDLADAALEETVIQLESGQRGDVARLHLPSAAGATPPAPVHAGLVSDEAAVEPTEPLNPTELIGEIIDDWAAPEPRLVVRVLGMPAVPSLDHPLGRRELITTVFMACAARPVRNEDLQDAVWGGKAVTPRTIWNVITRTRGALGTFDDGEAILGDKQRPGNTVTLAEGVWTDYALLREFHDRAKQVSASEAMGLLRRGLELVAGPPFDADGFDWAHVGQHVADAEALIERATDALIDLALTAGDIDVARYAVLQGLRGLPGNEVLYRARMRIEDQAGNPAAVQNAYRELVMHLNDLDVEPSEETKALYGRLARPSRR